MNTRDSIFISLYVVATIVIAILYFQGWRISLFNGINNIGFYKADTKNKNFPLINLMAVDPKQCGKSFVVCRGYIGEYCNPIHSGCGKDEILYFGHSTK